MTDNNAELDRRITAIVGYLARRQADDGEFPTLRAFPGEVPPYVAPTEFEGWFNFGKCPFCTANIIYHLAQIDLPGVAEICRKGCDFLARGMENGVARYVPAYAKAIDFPTDVDDTCLAAVALECNSVASGCNVSMVLDNIAPGGDIYTWLIPRLRHLRHPGNYLWLRRDKAIFDQAMAGHGTPPSRMAAIENEYRISFEPGVAANVLLYLGIDRRTLPLQERLIERIETDRMPPGYYASLIVAYFHVARLYQRGAKEFERVKAKILGFLAGQQRPDGEIDTPLHTALAALSFMYFGAWDAPALERAVSYVARHPMHRDGWLPLHYCNDLDGIFIDGGAELTATFYLEVMYRWRQRT